MRNRLKHNQQLLNLRGARGVRSAYADRYLLRVPFDGVDGATAAVDTSPYARVLTFAANAQLDTAFKYRGTASLLLDGTGDFVSAPNAPEFNIAADEDFTFIVRTRPASLATFTAFVSLWEAASNRKSWMVSLSTLGAIRFIASVDGIANTVDFSSANGLVVVLGAFYDIWVERRAGVITIYLNGVAVASAPYAGAFFTNNVDPLLIGASNNGTASTTNGHIDNVGIYK